MNDYEIEEMELHNTKNKHFKDMIFMLYREMLESGTAYNAVQETDLESYIQFLIYCINNPKNKKGGNQN